MIYRDLSQRVVRITRTPKKLQRELKSMGAHQIVKRHMMNKTFNNAQNSDRKITMKLKPAFKPKSLKSPAKNMTVQDKLKVLGHSSSIGVSPEKSTLLPIEQQPHGHLGIYEPANINIENVDHMAVELAKQTLTPDGESSEFEIKSAGIFNEQREDAQGPSHVETEDQKP